MAHSMFCRALASCSCLDPLSNHKNFAAPGIVKAAADKKRPINSCGRFEVERMASGRVLGAQGISYNAGCDALKLRCIGGETREQALSSRQGDLTGVSLNAYSRVNHRVKKRRNKMATMAVPRALMEDTSSESAARIGVESQPSEFGTFGDANGEPKESWKDSLEPSPDFQEWDSTTARLADSATAAFLLLQLPQIVLNTQNLISTNYAALSAIPWMPLPSLRIDGSNF